MTRRVTAPRPLASLRGTLVSPAEILAHLRSLAARERIALTLGQVEADTVPEMAYAPFGKYLEHLAGHSKPETAAEEVFRALARDVCGIDTFPQVFTGDGFVDFVLPEVNGSSVLVELKPLFTLYDASRIQRKPHNPKTYLAQVKKYLARYEYVVLTDLRTAWLYSARETFVSETFFAELPFADLLQRQTEQLSLLDVMRRAEDDAEKPDLDRQFFEDLREWFEAFANIKFRPGFDPAESVILLINKLVFAKTLEDHGLINYRWVQDEYELLLDRWETKGPHRVIKAFLQQFEDFFDEYYDTELFEHRIWERLETDEANLGLFARKLEAILGVGKWDRVFQRGLVHYNYRTINEDIFGKSYEMFLAANRKDEGIYYTPATITIPMADSMVASVFGPMVEEILTAIDKDTGDFETARALMAQLARLHLIDTASGSGGFLIKVLRAVWAQYQRISAGLDWLNKINLTGELFDLPASVREAALFREERLLLPGQRRHLVAAILLRHIFALDKDAGALEVAKTNVWKEAVKLTPADYNFRRLPGEAQKILPNLELNFICADSLVDLPLDRQVAWLVEDQRRELRELASCRAEYLANPSEHASLDHALKLRDQLRAGLREQFQTEPLPEPPSCLPLMFFPAWFDYDGTARENGGFDGIIGNPPWEAVKPVRKEFARIAKYSVSLADIDAWFATKLKEDADFAARWAAYQQFYEDYKSYLSRRFVHQGTGDWNLFKLFIEADLDLLRPKGRLSLLVPSSIQTDEGCTALRRLFTTNHTLEELTSFENRGYRDIVKGVEQTVKIFPDVDNRFKFGFFKLIKGQPSPEGHFFDARFYLHNPADAASPAIRYSVELMQRFSPHSYSIMEFRGERDYELCQKIRSAGALLGEHDYAFRREFHMTEDAGFFRRRTGGKRTKDSIPLIEGKVIHQFRADYAPVTYDVLVSEVRPELLRKELFRIARVVRDKGVAVLEGAPIPKKKNELEARLAEVFEAKDFNLHYELPRLAVRDVASSTNERTIIAAVAPANATLGNTVNYLQPVSYELSEDGVLTQATQDEADILALLSLLNSLTLNFYIRSKVSAHVNIHQLQELPIPTLTAQHRERLARIAAKLSKKIGDVPERAALEVFIARELYGLDAADWAHLTGTFTFGGESDSKAELDEIIRLSREHWPA